MSSQIQLFVDFAQTSNLSATAKCFAYLLKSLMAHMKNNKNITVSNNFYSFYACFKQEIHEFVYVALVSFVIFYGLG